MHPFSPPRPVGYRPPAALLLLLLLLCLLHLLCPQVEVRVTATVFSRKKGTPGLRPHVRCLGFSADTDTEGASDWQGF